MVLELIVTHQANLVLPLASAPLVLPKLGIMAPFWAIYGVIAHLISSFALEKSMVLC
jgi:hypothetical protein